MFDVNGIFGGFSGGGALLGFLCFVVLSSLTRVLQAADRDGRLDSPQVPC